MDEKRYIERVAITDKAKKIIDLIRLSHEEILFHQSKGCVDSSAPVCFSRDEFPVGSRNVTLGEIHGCKFYMSPVQFEYWQGTHLTIDAVNECGTSFSLESPLGFSFITVARSFTDEELEKLRPIA